MYSEIKVKVVEEIDRVWCLCAYLTDWLNLIMMFLCLLSCWGKGWGDRLTEFNNDVSVFNFHVEGKDEEHTD